MQDDETKREDLTRVEREDLTKVEKIPSEGSLSLKYFRDYKVVKEFPAGGGEADSFLIEKNSSKFFLKLYRKGIDPNIELLQKLKEISNKHREHLVEMIDVGYDEGLGRYYEVLEYVKWGDLKRVIKEISGLDYKQKEPIIDKAIEEIAEALKVLHEENIVHRDLKPSNILVRDRKSLDLVLIDFGIARQIREDVSKVVTTFKGTSYYIAPEEISGYFGKEIDWWHLGVIVYELLKEKNPFAGLSEQVVIHTLVTKGIEIPPDIPEKYKLLLRGLLTRDYRKRWGYEQIKAWLRGERNIPVYYEYKEKDEYKEKEKVDTEDEWVKYGFPKDSPWRTLGLSPEEAEGFRGAGFSVYEAKRWVEAGWRSGKGAKRWRDAGFEPEESLVFEQLGLSTSDARSIKGAGITAYDLSRIKETIKNLEDLQEFVQGLIGMLKSSQGTVEREKIAELVKEYSSWYEKGFGLKEAFEWFIAGIGFNEAKGWKDAGFKPSEARDWKNAGFKPSKVEEWRSAGFKPSEAKAWKDFGFKPLKAEEWRSAGFELSEAIAWGDAGFKPSEAKAWKNAEFKPSEAKEWRNAWFEPSEARAWRSARFELLEARDWKNAGFEPSEAKEWRNAWFEPSEARAWRSARFELSEARDWKNAGFEPSEAKEWRSARFELSEARDWKNAGFEPSEARAWRSARFELSEAKAWKNAGFKPSKVEEWRSAGFKPSEAKAWKDFGFKPLKAEEWKSAGFELSEAIAWGDAGFKPSEAKAWKNAEFKPSEAKEWKDAEFEPSEARGWIDSWDRLSTKSWGWRDAGFTPSEAIAWGDAGFKLSEAIAWKNAGFNPQEAKKWHNRMSIASGFISSVFAIFLVKALKTNTSVEIALLVIIFLVMFVIITWVLEWMIKWGYSRKT